MSDVDPFALSRAESFEERRTAVVALGALLDTDAKAFDRLVEMLDDSDTAVGAEAASELTARGGHAGLAATARAFTELDENLGYWIAGALERLIDLGVPVVDDLGELHRDHPDPRVRIAAAELRDYLVASR